MKKLYESPFAPAFEQATRIIVYEIEHDEWDELWDMTHEERLDYFGLYEEPDLAVQPGALYTRYDFDLTDTRHMVITQTDALNV